VLIETALSSGLTQEATAIGQVKTAVQSLVKSMGSLDPDVEKNAENVVDLLSQIETTLTDKVAAALSAISREIQGQKDYTAILRSIQQVLELFVSY